MERAKFQISIYRRYSSAIYRGESAQEFIQYIKMGKECNKTTYFQSFCRKSTHSTHIVYCVYYYMDIYGLFSIDFPKTNTKPTLLVDHEASSHTHVVICGYFGE